MATSQHSRAFRLASSLFSVVMGAATLALVASPAHTTPTPDTTAPTVSSRSPAGGDIGVGVGRSVQVTFSEAVQGVDATTFTLRAGASPVVAADITGAADVRTLNPLDSLDENTLYTVSLDGGATAIRDLANNPLADDTWTFRTRGDATAPTVTSRSPVPGATGVPVDGVVNATFSEEVAGVNATTFVLERAATGVQVPATVFRRGTTNRWTLSPDQDLRQDVRYSALLLGGPAGIRDLAGNALVDTDWSFTTRTDAPDPGDTRRPRVVDEFPSDGATRVSRLTDVRARFSEAVRGVNNRTFRLVNTRTSVAVAAEVFSLGGSNRWVLEPGSRLAGSTRYLVVLRGGGNGIRDLADNRLATTTWSFRTRS